MLYLQISNIMLLYFMSYCAKCFGYHGHFMVTFLTLAYVTTCQLFFLPRQVIIAQYQLSSIEYFSASIHCMFYYFVYSVYASWVVSAFFFILRCSLRSVHASFGSTFTIVSGEGEEYVREILCTSHPLHIFSVFWYNLNLFFAFCDNPCRCKLWEVVCACFEPFCRHGYLKIFFHMVLPLIFKHTARI